MTVETSTVKQTGQDALDDAASSSLAPKTISAKNPLSNLLNPSVVVIGAASLAGAYVSVDKNFHKQLRKLGAFDELDAARERSGKLLHPENLSKDVLLGDPTQPGHIPNVYDNKFTKAITDAKQTNKNTLRAVQNVYNQCETDIEHSLGIKNALQKWNLLEGYYKGSIGVRFATLGSVAVGAIYYGLSQQHSMAARVSQQANSGERQR